MTIYIIIFLLLLLLLLQNLPYIIINNLQLFILIKYIIFRASMILSILLNRAITKL